MKTYADLKNEYRAELEDLRASAKEAVRLATLSFDTAVDALVAEAVAAKMTTADMLDDLGIPARVSVSSRKRQNLRGMRSGPSRGAVSVSVCECAAKGMTQTEAARHLGVSRQRVNHIAIRNAILFPDGRRKGKILVGK